MRRPPSLVTTLSNGLMLVSLLAIACPARARAEDPWFGRDKALHFGASTSLSGGGYALAGLFTDEANHRLLFGGGLALAAGASKELHDLAGRGHASWRDMTWNAVGTATGLLVAWSIDRLLSRSAREHASARSRRRSAAPSPCFAGTLDQGGCMDAIELLEKQHRQVEELFERYESLGDKAMKSRLTIFEKLGDLFAVHAKIEEELFYPATKDGRTEDQLREAVEEHLSVKRICADLLEMEPDDPAFDAKVSVLKEQIEHHVEEEEEELFPTARKSLEPEKLEELGEQMQQLADELISEGEPRRSIPTETGEAAPI